jgi:hypothetical protein
MNNSLGALYARHTEHHLRPWEKPTCPEAQAFVQRLIAQCNLTWFCQAREAMRGERKWKA